jgi:hypothetical protein
VHGSQQLSAILGGLMAAQATAGLLWPGAYRDSAWITATWHGNDWITLVVAVPLLGIGLASSRRRSVRGTLLWLGVLGYALYNYAFYLLGAALNAFFLLYASGVVLAAIALIRALAASHQLQSHFRGRYPEGVTGTTARVLSGHLLFVGGALAAVWSAMWGAHVFVGRALPVAEPVFRLVAALDMVLMVPALVAGGTLLWRGHALGFIVAPIAAIQGALYLIVLSANAIVLASRGLGAFPGELVIWGPVAVTMSATAISLLILAGCDNRRT